MTRQEALEKSIRLWQAVKADIVENGIDREEPENNKIRVAESLGMDRYIGKCPCCEHAFCAYRRRTGEDIKKWSWKRCLACPVAEWRGWETKCDRPGNAYAGFFEAENAAQAIAACDEMLELFKRNLEAQ